MLALARAVGSLRMRRTYVSCEVPRSARDVFVPVLASERESLDASLQPLVRSAAAAVATGREQDFVACALETAVRLGHLPRDHAHHLEPRVLGPMQAQLQHVFGSAFRLAKCNGEGGGGHYLVGPPGVGKTTVLRTACMVVGLLLPQTAPVFGNRAAGSVADLVGAALRGRGVEEASRSLSMEPLRALARRHDLGVCVFLDDADEYYRASDWSCLRGLARNTDSVVFLSGSQHRLPLLVEAEHRQANAIRRVANREPLWRLELAPLYCHGLTMMRHYLELFGATREMAPVFASLRAAVGGSFSCKLDVFEPPSDPTQLQILELLRAETARKGFRSFGPAAVPRDALAAQIEGDIDDAVSQLQQKNLVAAGHDGIYLHPPLVYRALSNAHPAAVVFHNCGSVLPFAVRLLTSWRIASAQTSPPQKGRVIALLHERPLEIIDAVLANPELHSRVVWASVGELSADVAALLRGFVVFDLHQHLPQLLAGLALDHV